MDDVEVLVITKALERLISEYGHIMDRADWEALDEVFAPDAVCDWSSFGLETTTSLEHLQRYFTGVRHPTAHHVTNICVDVHDDSRARMRSKLLAVLDDGTTASGDYIDDVERREEGWRIVRRVAVARPRRSRGPGA